MTAVLPQVLNLGAFQATWVFAPDVERTESTIPTGVVVNHLTHTVLVPWVSTDAAPSAFTLDSLVPLTVVEPFTCSICGVRGRIVEGAWVPAEGGARG